jgi:hypothetical protein
MMAASAKYQRAVPWWRCIKKQINWGAWLAPPTNKYTLTLDTDEYIVNICRIIETSSAHPTPSNTI